MPAAIRSPTLAAPTSASGFTARFSRADTGVKSTSYPPRKREFESMDSTPRAIAADARPGTASAPADARVTPAGSIAAVFAGPAFCIRNRLASVCTRSVNRETTA